VVSKNHFVGLRIDQLTETGFLLLIGTAELRKHARCISTIEVRSARLFDQIVGGDLRLEVSPQEKDVHRCVPVLRPRWDREVRFSDDDELR